ncbi:MAG: LytR/AlgR family response regulator transcription factor [Flavobacteriaceae bacterium]
MNILIIEDEKPAARRLSRMLLESRPEDQIDMVHSVQQAVEYFSLNKHPDLMFLDIQLSDGLSFEIFEHVEVKSPIIFTTAYDGYALQAFKHNSIDYLLKPIDSDDLKQALDQFDQKKSEESDLEEMLKKMNQSLFPEHQKQFKSRWMIRLGSQFKLVKTQEITMFYSADKSSFLKTVYGRSYDLDETLDEIEKQVNPQEFFRINRSCILHIDHIDQINAYSNSRLQIKPKTPHDYELIIARDRVKNFKNWLAS